jgi:hypothetical protein
VFFNSLLQKEKGLVHNQPFFFLQIAIFTGAQAATAERVQRVAGSASAETVPAAAGYSYAARAAAMFAALRAPGLLKNASVPAA